ncbi:hypothetical protein [Serratia rhizosphaerae]|uniref:hypothetical protein n=1 Tax=Serratia rhizosphaerae TaxID=2597702 RepID=UPI002DC014DC|nr:hypothetical protein [Serratia rhizosphaerae]MEB6338123.1 hypothetical protein [Serratia rhizosphaerae]
MSVKPVAIQARVAYNFKHKLFLRQCRLFALRQRADRQGRQGFSYPLRICGVVHDIFSKISKKMARVTGPDKRY